VEVNPEYCGIVALELSPARASQLLQIGAGPALGSI
jgi:hypothetical protein